MLSSTAVKGLMCLMAGMILGVVAALSIVDRSTQPVAELSTENPVVVDVGEREFGRTLPISVRVDWSGVTSAAPLMGGIVTGLPVASLVVEPGLELLAVNGEPVLLGIGAVPAYRDLHLGLVGDDVRQLQSLLEALGMLGPEDISGIFDSATEAAVRMLNEEYGRSPMEEVPLGTVVFLKEGAYILTSPVVLGSSAPPTLEFTFLDPSGPELTGITGVMPELSAGLRVSVEDVGMLQVASVELDGLDALLKLTSPTGGSACPTTTCQLEPPFGLALVASGVLELVPSRRGTAVPSSALELDAAGRVFVVSDDGLTHIVRVIVQQDGFALIEDLPDIVRRVRLGG